MDTNETAPGDAGGAQSVDRALGLLSVVASGGGAQVPMTELVARTGLSRPTVRRLLLALMRAGLVEQEAGSGYALGPEAQVLGVMAARRFDLVGAAQDSLIALSRESEDSSFVSLRRGSYSVCLHREEGSFPIRNLILQAGDRHPLGLGAGSMAILASLPEAEADEILASTRAEVERSYPNFTEGWLVEELERARQRGWSLNPGRRMASSWAIGVPIFDPAGTVVGSLSIAALDTRMGEDRQGMIVDMLRRESAAVTRRLAAQRRA